MGTEVPGRVRDTWQSGAYDTRARGTESGALDAWGLGAFRGLGRLESWGPKPKGCRDPGLHRFGSGLRPKPGVMLGSRMTQASRKVLGPEREAGSTHRAFEGCGLGAGGLREGVNRLAGINRKSL